MMRESGQALLFVLLAVAVVLVLVFSIISRSLLDVTISSKDEESLRAFTAAEAGIEQALVASTAQVTGNFGTSTYNAQIQAFPDSSREYVYPKEIFSGESATIWFVSHDPDNNLICNATFPCFTGHELKFCWGKPGTLSGVAETPAIEASVLYEESGAFKFARDSFDPNNGRRLTNGFGSASASGCTIAGQDFAFQTNLNLSSLGVPPSVSSNPGGLKLIKVRSLYNTLEGQTLGILSFGSSSSFPSQGRAVESTGVAGESTRKVVVYALYSEPPSVFDSAVFSLPGLLK